MPERCASLLSIGRRHHVGDLFAWVASTKELGSLDSSELGSLNSSASRSADEEPEEPNSRAPRPQSPHEKLIDKTKRLLLAWFLTNKDMDFALVRRIEEFC